MDIKLLAAVAQAKASAGLIDDLSNLKKSKVYLYRGMNDATYLKESVKNVGKLLVAMGALVLALL